MMHARTFLRLDITPSGSRGLFFYVEEAISSAINVLEYSLSVVSARLNFEMDAGANQNHPHCTSIEQCQEIFQD